HSGWKPMGSFTAADIVIFSFVVVFSAAIGIYYGWRDRGQGNAREFLTGSHKLNALPVSMSLSASFMSSVTLLSVPVEVYYYGAIFGLISFSYLFAIMISSELFLPVFYRLDIASTYEYLELRFNKATRLLGTVLFIFQTVLLTGVVTYAPALALSQVADMNLWAAISSTALVCTFYCALVGENLSLKINQIIIMFAGSLSVIIKSAITQGGISVIISDSQEGGRLNIWDFDINPMRRHTFWTVVIGGAVGWTSVYGINQAQVQRYNACKSMTQARIALYLNFFGVSAILISSVMAGLCAYSVLKSCDPRTVGMISAPDQLMPFLVMNITRSNPGLMGLFCAAVYSGSLSTVSSCINALAAVTVEDLIKPYIRMSERCLAMTSKALTVVVVSVQQLTSVISAITGGPLLALFGLGILCPFANAKGVLSGVVVGLILTVWLTAGEIIFPSPPEMTRPLLLTTDGCNFSSNANLSLTSSDLPTLISSPAPLHGSNSTNSLTGHWQSPSYLYTCTIGMITSLIVGLIVSLLTGGRNEKVQADLMLMKEDTLMFHLYKYTRNKVRVVHASIPSADL
uniref:Sodium-coupled monocarboxylate transporter 1-like n=1 Tax=Gouania willdenowi TaxID=441366 RepID=A0A8C5DYV1_GOUWI